MNRIFNICPINPGDPVSLNQSDLGLITETELSHLSPATLLLNA